MENLLHYHDHKLKTIKYLAYCGQVEQLRFRSKLVKELTKDRKPQVISLEENVDGDQSDQGQRSGIMYEQDGEVNLYSS